MMNLEQFDKAFEEAEATTNATVDLPAGKYVCNIIDPEIFESKDGRVYLKLKLKVAEGDLKGQAAQKMYSLDNPERFRFLKGDLFAMGLAVNKVSALPGLLPKINGLLMNVSVVQKDKYTNYYLNNIAKTATTPEGGVPF